MPETSHVVERNPNDADDSNIKMASNDLRAQVSTGKVKSFSQLKHQITLSKENVNLMMCIVYCCICEHKGV